MVKVSFNSALAHKEAANKEEENSQVLILPPDAKEPEDVVVPAGHKRAWCWCMCFGLAFMLAGVILGGAYLYKYFAFQQGGVYFCGIKYIEDGLSLPESGAQLKSARYHTIEQNIQILEEEDVEFISVPVPEFADSDPADIVHDFHRRLTAYLDLSLDKCYVIPLNTSVVMPPKNFLELLINIKAGTYLPQSYLIHEQMIVTDRIENVDQLGFFIYRLCRGKETYKLQRKEAMKGIQKREAVNCRKIRHFENRFAMETLICEQ
uniref:Integral membrane protein 2B n=1 Tax=Gallus gallus TaxID=9031 RepID=ITM2B_CHICK|nr:RecName: Full=Integral membrane protein 2B; AltName: Full=Transmembrane protein E3-16 [Gallus gallus]AAB70816.1 putative transmembrane protein E3-16 [Gallus gallus]